MLNVNKKLYNVVSAESYPSVQEIRACASVLTVSISLQYLCIL